MKTCNRCHLSKEESCFYKNATNKRDGLSALCKECIGIDHKSKQFQKVCMFCGKAFTTNRNRTVFCSRKCALKSVWRKTWSKRAHLQSQVRLCKTCGSPFSLMRKTSLYCSISCASKSKRNINNLTNIQPLAANALRGHHGFGGSAQHNLNHAKARPFRIRSPLGEIYDGNNFLSWCVKNAELFEPDDCKEARWPLWKRAYFGIKNLSAKHHSHRRATSWKGWTVVITEYEKDPIRRRVVLIL